MRASSMWRILPHEGHFAMSNPSQHLAAAGDESTGASSARQAAVATDTVGLEASSLPSPPATGKLLHNSASCNGFDSAFELASIVGTCI